MWNVLDHFLFPRASNPAVVFFSKSNFQECRWVCTAVEPLLNKPLLMWRRHCLYPCRVEHCWPWLASFVVGYKLTDNSRITLLFAQTLGALPDQDSFYDVTDCLEQLGMEKLIQRHMNNKGTDPDLKQRLALYEVSQETALWCLLCDMGDVTFIAYSSQPQETSPAISAIWAVSDELCVRRKSLCTSQWCEPSLSPYWHCILDCFP